MKELYAVYHSITLKFVQTGIMELNHYTVLVNQSHPLKNKWLKRFCFILY